MDGFAGEPRSDSELEFLHLFEGGLTLIGLHPLADLFPTGRFVETLSTSHWELTNPPPWPLERLSGTGRRAPGFRNTPTLAYTSFRKRVCGPRRILAARSF